MPDLGGAIAWLNSPPLDRQSLRGKVVLVDIWTYSCINRLRQFPYVMNWAAKYKDAGLLTNTKRSRSARRIIASIDRARFALNATWAR
jgi:thiol-disulfide isomerase/thioredoxin